MTTSASSTAKSSAAGKTKSATTAAAKPVTKAASKGAVAAVPQPSLRFYHSAALRSKTNAVLAALEASEDQQQHGEAVADLVQELIEAGMDYYFLRALKMAQIGFVAEQSARLGMSGAVKLISSVSRKFIMHMDKQQLLIVASHIRALT